MQGAPAPAPLTAASHSSGGLPAAAREASPRATGAASSPRLSSRRARLGLAGAGAVAVLVGLVLLVRWWRTTASMQAFIAHYPGEYALPASATAGFPGWVRWTHFLTFFFMVLIIRTGLQVRHQKKPPAYWTPPTAKGGAGKISLTLWFHQTLDVLWLANGLVFVVLLFASNHWTRLVPSSWEVFPQAASVLVQYVSLDWPTENGWVNYNSLQQLTYFAVVFVAAPLAAATGFRMSSVWPARAKTLSRVYPLELARALHYPTMLFFSVFIIFHVTLVFATGARRNLNHMFAGSDAVNWVGFSVFAAGIAVTVLAWVAARPVVLASIAGLMGRVSNR